MRTLLTTIAGAALLTASAAHAAPVTFPENPNDPMGPQVTVDEMDFADAVEDFDQVAPAASAPDLNDPSNVLGAPDFDAGPGSNDDTGAFSLGEGGFVTVEFTDNFLTRSGDSDADLFVGEVGSVVETINVEISQDGTNFFSVGQLTGQDRAIDIDAFLANTNAPNFFRFVRITDLIGQPSNQGSNPGADIDFVAALSSTEIPVPAAAFLFAPVIGLVAARRKRSK